MRLIDADEAIEMVGFDDFAETLNMCPTADAKPVVHAHWEVNNAIKVNDNPYPFYTYNCSKCGRTESSPCRIDEFVKNTPYCHCGAKMDEEE